MASSGGLHLPRRGGAGSLIVLGDDRAEGPVELAREPDVVRAVPDGSTSDDDLGALRARVAAVAVERVGAVMDLDGVAGEAEVDQRIDEMTGLGERGRDDDVFAHGAGVSWGVASDATRPRGTSSSATRSHFASGMSWNSDRNSTMISRSRQSCGWSHGWAPS